MKTLNQGERQPMAVADQVAVLYAATNGYLDRIDVDRVAEFHRDLVERLHSAASETLEKIADGDWSDEIAEGARRGDRRVRRRLRLRPRRGGPAGGRAATRRRPRPRRRSDSDDDDDGDDDDDDEEDSDKEAVGAGAGDK